VSDKRPLRSPRTVGEAAAALDRRLDRWYERDGRGYVKAPFWSACVFAIPAIIAIATALVNLYAPISLVKLPVVVALVSLPRELLRSRVPRHVAARDALRANEDPTRRRELHAPRKSDLLGERT
jgi:hypothetical protein